ncbi:C2H2-type zinc finger protein [Halostella sp. JP-L12]|uniref:DUF7410 domain-containing protein n=1 Tax=Halostella TaxID=1843185 RepID=UPI000EF77ADE|nr:MULTISPECIES: C2H2-type zinc finger protein [Halostella]NHN49928.1 C2H2-type zinc finger protein [Halostella sp. JP-L12]
MSTDTHPDAPADDADATTAVPPGETTHDCPYCGRPFSDPEYRTLHVGLDHHEECTEAELEAFQDAYREEGEEIRLFRLKAIGALVLLYFGFLFTYSFVT